MLFESELIKPNNWDTENHKYFSKIFTWNDTIVDGEKYIKYCWPNKIPPDTHYDIKKKDRLCTMIVAHKQNKHPLELYSERIKAIRWFEGNHPKEFDLYGMGWDKYNFTGEISYLNRYDIIRKLFKPKYPSYKGTVISKMEELRKYKFSFCYENARDIPGYITEKIFDSFFAGCVPIYLGAPNIGDYIPENTFIDKREFNNYKDLFNYIATMGENEYEEYVSNIKEYLNSDSALLFSAERFTENILYHMLPR